MAKIKKPAEACVYVIYPLGKGLPLCLYQVAEEKKLVTFEQAIRKQTALTAEFWGLKDRGRIAEGYIADLVLIDRNKLYDRADFKNSNQKSDGIEAVYVAGQCVYQNKELTGVYPGHVLRRGE